MSFHPNTLVEMIDGSLKIICDVQVGDDTRGGIVLGTLRSVEQEFYWYGGVLVTGDHLVRENTTWVRVKDSEHGRLFKYLTEVSSNLITDKKCIWAHGSEFADATLINNMGAY